MEWLEPAFRWIHVIAGVLWIGLLYFFNWVNGPFAKTLDAESKKKVVPELLPRALYFFRWGAAYTWISGLLLLALVYYHAAGTLSSEVAGHGKAMGLGLAVVFVGAALYDLLWKSPLAKNQTVAAAISFVLVVAAMLLLDRVGGLTGRALFIHVGALFGTAMAMNVWMRIWPSQRKIIAAIAGGSAPDGALVALAGLRSKHNTYMSVPLLFLMVSNHHPAAFGFGGNQGWIVLAGVILLGWLLTWAIYKKAGSPAPSSY